MVFSKPDRGLDWRPIPFDTLQVEISLTHKGGEVVVMHGNAFMLDMEGRRDFNTEDDSSALAAQEEGTDQPRRD
jgi:hypothetical protein